MVWALGVLFNSRLGDHLVFKGGTSLSKAYRAIERFSEDVDLTYDIRTIAADLVDGAVDALPPTNSQADKWTKAIRDRLKAWTDQEVRRILADALAILGDGASLSVHDDTVNITYRPLAAGTGYVSPVVRLEFGARSTGEPWETIAGSSPRHLLGVACRGENCAAASDAVEVDPAPPGTCPGVRSGVHELRAVSITTGASQQLFIANDVIVTPRVSPTSGDLIYGIGGNLGHLQTIRTPSDGNLYLRAGVLP